MDSIAFMDRGGFVASCLLALCGVNALFFCVAVQQLYPQIGYLIYQSHSPASYDRNDYNMDLTVFSPPQAPLL